MPKLFTNAGISTDSDGIIAYRMAMDIDSRTKTLEYNGHTDIEFYKLPRPMLRLDAIDYLQTRKGVYVEDGAIVEGAKRVAAARTRVVDEPELTPAKKRRYDTANEELAAAEAAAMRARAKMERISA